jgi:pSer/pThr/pTyr-binding forkhead associated (FHA) protein
MVQTQARQVPPKLPPGAVDPCTRPPPRPERASQPHCLVSAVLDQPLVLPRDKKTIIGRDGLADVSVKSDLVSRRHAEIGWGAVGFTINDLGSVNGTLVNGVRLSGPCYLHADDRISVAGFEVVVRVVSPGDAPEQPTEGGGTTRLLKPELAEELAKDALAGELGSLGLRDIVDLLEWKKHSGTLTVNPVKGPPGRLYVKSGTIVHAETKIGGKGMDAAVRLLRVTAGRFNFTPGKPRCPVTITCGNEDLWTRAERPG